MVNVMRRLCGKCYYSVCVSDVCACALACVFAQASPRVKCSESLLKRIASNIQSSHVSASVFDEIQAQVGVTMMLCATASLSATCTHA